MNNASEFVSTVYLLTGSSLALSLVSLAVVFGLRYRQTRRKS